MNNTSATGLRKALAALYTDQDQIRRVARDAGLDISSINFDKASGIVWHTLLEEAEKNNRVEKLVEIAEEEYGTNPQLRAAINAYRASLPKFTHINTDNKHEENSQSSPRHSRKSSPLPALVNREKQISHFKATFRPHRPLIYILYGGKKDGHEFFLQRIMYELMVWARKRSIKVEPKDWHLPWASLEPGAQSLPENICQELRLYLTGEKPEWRDEAQAVEQQMREINAYMYQHLKSPLLIHTWVPIKEREGYKDQKILEFVRFWQQWATLEQPFPELIVFLCLTIDDQPLSKGRMIWHRLSRKATDRSLIEPAEIKQFFSFPERGSDTCIVLDRMQMISLTDIEEWTRREEVKELQLRSDVKKLIASYKAQKQDEVPMEEIHEKLLSLIQEQPSPAGQNR